VKRNERPLPGKHRAEVVNGGTGHRDARHDLVILTDQVIDRNVKVRPGLRGCAGDRLDGLASLAEAGQNVGGRDIGRDDVIESFEIAGVRRVLVAANEIAAGNADHGRVSVR